MYEKLNLPIVESRLDWITCTADLDHYPEVLRRHGELRVADYEREGYAVQPWRFKGYHGVQCGLWRVGYGKQGTIAVVSGIEAEEEAMVLARYASHWSRVDYCTTIYDGSGAVNPVLDYWGVWPPMNLPANRQRALTTIQQYHGGQSVMLGRRSSAYYVRVYDKTAESGGEYPDRCWRFEIELKRHASEYEHLRWKSGAPRLSHASNMVAEHLSKYSLPVPWQGRTPIRQAIDIKRVRDIDRTMTWLREQVRPSVEWASALLGEEVVSEALGLPYIAPGGEVLH